MSRNSDRTINYVAVGLFGLIGAYIAYNGRKGRVCIDENGINVITEPRSVISTIYDMAVSSIIMGVAGYINIGVLESLIDNYMNISSPIDGNDIKNIIKITRHDSSE
jgi:hypothetical protein